MPEPSVTSEYVGNQWVAVARWSGPGRQRVKIMRSSDRQDDAEHLARSEAVSVIEAMQNGEAVPVSERIDEDPEAVEALRLKIEQDSAEVERLNRQALEAEAARQEATRQAMEREAQEAEAARAERL